MTVGFISFCPFYRAKKRMAEEMKLRTVESQALWKSKEVREFAARVSEVIREGLWWPNAYFVPEDRCDVIFYGHGDALNGPLVIQDILKECEIPKRRFSQNEVCNDLNCVMYGEFIEKLMSACETQGNTQCPR